MSRLYYKAIVINTVWFWHKSRHIINGTGQKPRNINNGGERVYSINGAGKTGQLHVKKKNKKHFLTPYRRINLKWIKGLNERSDTIKLRGKHRQNTDIIHSNAFFNPSLRVIEIRTKISKWDPIKLKIFCTAKETISKKKSDPQNGSKYFRQGINLQNLRTVHGV